MKISDEYKELTWQGLWKNNPGLVQLLGLCPLLAVTSTVTNALGLGLATMFVLICSNATVSAIQQWVPKEIRIPIFVLIIAAFVTCVQLLMNAFTYGLYQSLGIFLPLIVTNCAIIGRAEAYASKNPLKQASFDGFMMGLGFLLVLIVLGGIREILGQGTLFDGADLLLGEWASVLRVEVFHLDNQFKVIKQLRHFDSGQKSIRHIRNLFETKERIWIATQANGINFYNKKSQKITQYKSIYGDSTSLNNNKVLDIFQDKTGLFWLGTWNGGANLFDLNKQPFKNYISVPFKKNSLNRFNLHV